MNVKHNHIYVYLSMTTRFGLHRLSSGHYYKTFKIRQNVVQLSFTLWNPICVGQWCHHVQNVWRSLYWSNEKIKKRMTAIKNEEWGGDWKFLMFCNSVVHTCTMKHKPVVKKAAQTAYLNCGKWPTWCTISSVISLFESSACFEQLCAHPQEDNCINTTSGIITLC